MCDESGPAINIPSPVDAARGIATLLGFAVDNWRVTAALAGGAAVVVFTLANAAIVGAAVALFVVVMGSVVVAMRVAVNRAGHARAKVPQRVAITRGYPLPRNLAITQGQRALPAPAEYHVHLHGVSPDDVAAIVNRRELHP